MIWKVGSGLLIAWTILHFFLHKRGWIHMLLLAGISLLFIHWMAYRKTKYAERMAGK
jgi:hypothetical protein